MDNILRAKVSKNATCSSCLPAWRHHLWSTPCQTDTLQAIQDHPQVSDRLQHYTRPQDFQNAKCAPPSLLPGLLGQAGPAPLSPYLFASTDIASTIICQKHWVQLRPFEKCEIIAQGGVHQNRALVDTKTHASCAARQNRDKQTVFPTSWGKAERTN